MAKPAIIGDTFVYVVGQTIDDRPEIAPEGSIFQDDSTGFQHWVRGGVWKLANHMGLSTDVKPTDDTIPDGAWFYEEDTRTDYRFLGGVWTFENIRPTPEEIAARQAEMEARYAGLDKKPQF
jgi:hypothetical protein